MKNIEIRRHCWFSVLALLAFCAIFSPVCTLRAQVTGAIVSFAVTNDEGYIIVSDTNSGGRQAIQTSTIMFYTNSSHLLATNVFQLAYQLLDGSGQPVPILDEKGNSNFTYSVYQTNQLPILFVTSYFKTNNAPLQPLVPLSYYETYTPQLQVNAGVATANPTLTNTGQNASQPLEPYLDFTNTVSPDASPDLLVVMEGASLTRSWAISNSPSQGGFPVNMGVKVARYDNFTLPASAMNTAVTLNFQLLNAVSGVPVPLQSSQAVFNVSIESHDDSSPPNPVAVELATNFSLIPMVQLDSVDNTYQIVVTLDHTIGSVVVSDYTNALPASQLLDFDGQLYFGSLLTYFTNLDAAPKVTGTVPGVDLACQLEVTTNAGWLPGAPGNTYGNGSNIAVTLLTNGTAEIADGAVVMLNNQGPGGSNQSSQNISFQTTSLELTSAGASEQVTLTLPVGFGVAPVNSNSRLSLGVIALGTVALNENLAFESNSLTIQGPFQAVAESLPYLFFAPSVQWTVNSGTLSLSMTGGTFMRQAEDDLLIANQSALADTNMANRVSNDGYFRNATPGGNLVVTADADGMAQVSCQLGLNPPELRPHFPYSGNQPGQQIPIAPNGSFFLQNGVVSASSSITVDGSAPVSYARDTGGTSCGSSLAGPAVLQFTPAGSQLGFTADGGLLASGLVPPTNLTWGYVGGANYAEEVLNIQPCMYEMAGTFLAGGPLSSDPEEVAGVLLLSGFGHGAETGYVERPGEANYYAGLASYPGLNFIAPTNGSSYLAGETNVSYLLAPDSKYYARYGGVSGIQDAADFPTSPLTLYGYSFAFNAYRLSFLNNDVDESLTSGAITFPPEPAGFIQPFANMRFSGRGFLETADVPPTNSLEHLNYWNANITPESIEFQPSTNDPCGTGERWLVLGVATTLPFIPQELHASLGFWPDGNLVTYADGVSGCDSRFAVPAQLSLRGPGNSSFVMSTASDGYFNNWSNASKPTLGFYSLAGKLRVPFFEDVRVHLHIAPLGTNAAQISVMGGWPDPSTPIANNGWCVFVTNSAGNITTNTYFNQSKFDPSAEGYPVDQGVSISAYENSVTPLYNPVAQRNWIQVAVFDYPMTWNSTLREFAGLGDAMVVLPVINVNSHLKEVSPGKVDFDFAQNVSLQLPVLKVLDLLNDAAGEVDPALQSLSNAVQSELNTSFDTVGLNELQSLLREDPTTLFQPILSSAFSPVVDQLYTELASYSQSDKHAFLTNAFNQVQNNSALTGSLKSINGAPGQANSIIGRVNQTLTDAHKDLNQFISILQPDMHGVHQNVGGIIAQLISDQAPALNFTSNEISSVIGDPGGLVTNVDQTLNEIQSEFQTLSNQFTQAQGSLDNGSFSQAMSEIVDDTASAQQFVQLAANNVSNLLFSSITPAGDYFTANPAAAKQAINQQLINAFLSSPLSSDYQQTVRQFLFDNNAVLDELMDTTFDQISESVRDGLTDFIEDQSDNTFSGLKNMTNGLGSPTLLTAKIRGAPTFNGDSLRKIHLDAAVKMNVPNAMNFNAYMEIKELNSQSIAVDCIPAGDPAAEVTLGAKNVKLDWAALNDNGTPLTLTIGAKFTLQNHDVIGVGGLFDVKGEIGFQGCSVNELGASMAFGAGEYYFACKAAGTVTVIFVPVGVEVGVFVGRACTLNPILFIDPLASDVLGPDKLQVFDGIYVTASANLSLSEILFGESSCALDIGVTESTAVFYEGNLPNMSLGTRQTTAVDASLLCLISASASLTMGDVYSTTLPGTYGLTLSGTADICGSIGPCPFCISGCKSVGISGTVNTGGIHYSVSY